MRRSLMMIVIGLLLVVLTACTFEIIDTDQNSNGEAAQNTSENETSDESTRENDDNQSVLDVYKKAIDAAEEIKSAEIAVEMDQIFGYDGETMEMSSNLIVQMVTDPLIMHQKGTVGTPFAFDDDGSMDMEMYITDEDMYMYEAFSGNWIHMSSNDVVDMSEVDEQQEPYEQLKMFEDHIEHFSIEVTNDAYVLSLTADADSFEETFREMVDDTMPGDVESLFDDVAGNPFENADIERLAYQITIDKNSLQLKEYDMQMDMTIMVEGEEIGISQDIRTVYSKINEIDSIEIPQEVIDEASRLF